MIAVHRHKQMLLLLSWPDNAPQASMVQMRNLHTLVRDLKEILKQARSGDFGLTGDVFSEGNVVARTCAGGHDVMIAGQALSVAPDDIDDLIAALD